MTNFHSGQIDENHKIFYEHILVKSLIIQTKMNDIKI